MILRKLAPPIIQPRSILQRVTGVRPMREGKFNISKEVRGHQCLVHCYGHGGSGFTTVFGSVSRAIALLENEKVKRPIRIIGAGVLGLVSAIELTRQGYKVAGITAEQLYDITSCKAAGLFAIVSLKTSPIEEKNLEAISIDTFTTYVKIHEGKHAYLSSNFLRYLPLFCSNTIEAGVEMLVNKGLLPIPNEVDLDFGEGVVRKGFLEFKTYFIDTTKMMKELWNEVKQLDIPIEIGTLKSFEEIKEEVIVNCSGLGSRELNRDMTLMPVRGHLLLLNSEAGNGHMDYLLYAKVEQEEKEEYIYLFPKTEMLSSSNRKGIPCQGVLGGTFIPQNESVDEKELVELDRLEFQKIFNRSSLFFSNVD